MEGWPIFLETPSIFGESLFLSYFKNFEIFVMISHGVSDLAKISISDHSISWKVLDLTNYLNMTMWQVKRQNFSIFNISAFKQSNQSVWQQNNYPKEFFLNSKTL